MEDLITELFLKTEKRVQVKFLFLMGIALLCGIVHLLIRRITKC